MCAHELGPMVKNKCKYKVVLGRNDFDRNFMCPQKEGIIVSDGRKSRGVFDEKRFK